MGSSNPAASSRAHEHRRETSIYSIKPNTNVLQIELVRAQAALRGQTIYIEF